MRSRSAITVCLTAVVIGLVAIYTQGEADALRAPNTDADNAAGFSALPGGSRHPNQAAESKSKDETTVYRHGYMSLCYHAAGWELLDVRRIWPSASLSGGDTQRSHTAFTDLARFRDAWHCVFREGKNHFIGGHLRVIRSQDGKEWETAFTFTPEPPFVDARDAKLLVADDRLVIVGHEVGTSIRRSMQWISEDGTSWDGPFYSEGGDNTWIWGVARHKGTGYGVAYAGKHERRGAFYRTDDFKTWELVADAIFPGGAGTEAAFFIDDDDRVVMLLRDAGKRRSLGFSKPPYDQWRWESPKPPIGSTIGGPAIIRLSDGRVIVGGRTPAPVGGCPHSDRQVMFFEWDLENNNFYWLFTLPAMMDSGYPGFVEHDGELWISYYSTHENQNPTPHYHHSNPAIFLARVKIGGVRKTRQSSPR